MRNRNASNFDGRGDPTVVSDILHSPTKKLRRNSVLPAMTPSTELTRASPTRDQTTAGQVSALHGVDRELQRLFATPLTGRPDIHSVQGVGVPGQMQRVQSNMLTPAVGDMKRLFATPMVKDRAGAESAGLIQLNQVQSPNLMQVQTSDQDQDETEENIHKSPKNLTFQSHQSKSSTKSKDEGLESNSAHSTTSRGRMLNPIEATGLANNEQLQRFKNITQKHYILQIDNQFKNRVNNDYVGGYYKKLSEHGIIPTQQKEETSQKRSNSVCVTAEEMKNKLGQKSSKNELLEQSLQMLSPSSHQPIQLRNRIVTNLQERVHSDQKEKASQFIRQQNRTEMRENVKKDLVGVKQQEFPGYELPFNLRGQHVIDHFTDSEHSSVMADNEYDDMNLRDDIDSQILDTVDQNYNQYEEELKTKVKKLQPPHLRKGQSVRSVDLFDNEPDLADERIQTTSTLGKFKEEEDKEPERDFNKLKARIRLKAIKKFNEDNQKSKARQHYFDQKYEQGLREIQNKPPRTVHGPILRRRSFTEMQLKFEENLELYEGEERDPRDPSYRDKDTKSRMIKTARYPIPEELMNQPKPFWLQIDSFMHANYNFEQLKERAEDKLELYAPKNSSESDEGLFGLLDTSEEEIVQKEIVDGPIVEEKFKASMVDMQPFNLNRMGVFPHKHRENEPPLKLIIKSDPIDQIKATMDAFELFQEGPPLTEEEIALKKLQEEEEEENNRLGLKKEKEEKPRGTKYTNDQVDEIWAHYCEFFKLPKTKITRWIVPADNKQRKLSIKNYALSEQQIKALCATLPFIPDLFELELIKCQITDMLSTIIVFAAYFCPSLKRLSLVQNPVATNFRTTLLLIQEQIDPNKFLEFNFGYSIQKVELMDSFAKFLRLPIVKLNLEGVPLGMQATRKMNQWLLYSASIKDLNLMKCQLADQAARYIVDAVNRNITIRHLNLSYNNFKSTIYEFGIKFASIICRHPTLLHCQISSCQLTKQETMFIVVAMSMSKSFLSLHISNNDLPYYERIFLRSIIAARVHNNTKYDNAKLAVKMNKDRASVLTLASREFLEKELKRYIKVFNQLEEQREGLDFEINDLIQEIDLEKFYTRGVPDMNFNELPKNSKLRILIEKIREREAESKKKFEVAKKLQKASPRNLIQELDELSLSGVDSAEDLPKKNPFAAHNQQEQSRRQKEMEQIKKKKERSAGELALLFMGINEAAFDLLIENPMTGYMQECIFTRILGQDDIEQGNYWADTTLCYICARWEKVTISFDSRTDGSAWTLKSVQMQNLEKTIHMLNDQVIEAEQIEEAKLRAIREAEERAEYERRKALELTSDEEEEKKPTNPKDKVKDQEEKQEEEEKQPDLFQKPPIRPEEPREVVRERKKVAVDQEQIEQLGPQLDKNKYGGYNGLQQLALEYEEEDQKQLLKENNIKDVVDHQKYKIRHEGNIKTPEKKIRPPVKEKFNQEDPIQPKTVTLKKVQKHVIPEQFVNAKDFEMYVYSRPQTPQEEEVSLTAHDKYVKGKTLSRYGGPLGGLPPGLHQFDHLNKDRKQVTKQLEAVAEHQENEGYQEVTIDMIKQLQQGYTQRPQSPGGSSVAASQMTTSVIGGLRGQPQKIQRTMFVGGVVYVIEEEVYSDSDNSSVYTSEDSFEEDRYMVQQYVDQRNTYDAEQQKLADQRRADLLNPALTDQQKRLRDMGVLDDKFQPLTELQKEYRTKIWPKHYIPITKEYKSEQLDLVGKELEIRIGGVKQGKRTMIDRGPLIESGPLPEEYRTNMILYASFNDWMPVRLKTKRQLVFEKLNPDEPIPKATFVLDNWVFLYANYVPPGKHFFFFLRKEGHISLSPFSPIVRFRETNIFMNQITVKPRVMDFDAVNIVKGGDDEEVVFLKDKSVFRDYRDDTKPYLKKCFEQDMEYTKLSKTVKGDEEQLSDLKVILEKNYQKLNNIFLYYQGISSYPTIGLNDFTSWAKNCNFVDDKWINLAALDRILITTNVALHGLINNSERDLNRYEFLEVIVRLGNARYKDSKIVETSPQALVKTLNENVFPNSREVNGENFRRFQCYNVKVNEILQKNESLFKKVYDSFTHSKKKTIRLDECREFVLKCGMNVSQMQVGVIYAESMMTLIDTIINRDMLNQMKLVEFFVFLCRISFEHYRGTPYENEMMYLKLEKTVPMYLNYLQLTPIFLFNEEFEYKPAAKKQKRGKKAKKQVVKKDSSSSAISSSSEEEEEESSSEEDLAECIVLQEGTFKLQHTFIQKMEREKRERAERRAKKLEELQKKELEKQKKAQEKKDRKKAAKARGEQVSSDTDDYIAAAQAEEAKLAAQQAGKQQKQK